jgi:hypothetical protein
MTELIACLSTGKGTWLQVANLIKSQEWEKVYLITNDFGKQNFKPDEKTRLIIVNENEGMDAMVASIKGQLSEVVGPEVAFNMVSGGGKEHMAALSAVLKLGLGIRLVYIEGEKFFEL